MADNVSKKIRSQMMSAVRGKNTKPELVVRKALFAAGYRYHLHRKDLPGSPDINLPRYKIVIFVHGCFWHGHSCIKGKRPTSNVDFWNKKIDGNIVRDKAARIKLRHQGWSVLTIWGCSLKKEIQQLLKILDSSARSNQRVCKISRKKTG